MTNEPHLPGPAQDLRGWFYRAIVPDVTYAVLEVGDAHLSNWFPNVVRKDLLPVDAGSAESGSFDIVVIHRSLGGCGTLQDALLAARRQLRKGGMLAVCGENRLRHGNRGNRILGGAPRASGWGFRRALQRAGFDDVALHVAHPPDAAPLYVIDAHPRSARAFFGAQLDARGLSKWSLRRLVSRVLVATNLMPYLHPAFIVIGRRC